MPVEMAIESSGQFQTKILRYRDEFGRHLWRACFWTTSLCNFSVRVHPSGRTLCFRRQRNAVFGGHFLCNTTKRSEARMRQLSHFLIFVGVLSCVGGTSF